VAFELLLPIEETFINMEEQIPENSFDRFKLWFHNLRLPNGMQTAPNPRKISRLLASLWHPRFSRGSTVRFNQAHPYDGSNKEH
jgi:hypothetical protein